LLTVKDQANMHQVI